MPTGGELIVGCLKAQGVDRVFCVPGESYLEVLDALHDSGVDVVACRQEGGAAMAAEADGKLTGRPGVCLVTRGPGATNAAAGVHVAMQDATPMVLLVGQIGRRMRGRDAFQEVDYRQTFGDLAKWVEQIDHADRIPEVMSHAFHVAMAGRPGPVVLALPEDMLRDVADAAPGPRVEVAEPAPAPEDVARFAQMLREAERPVMILGGSRWRAEDVALAQDFAARHDLPTAISFRRQQLFDHLHPAFAGDVGLGVNPALKTRVAQADLVILLGARLSENPSQGFTLLDIPRPRQRLVHIHPGAEEIGRIYAPDLGVNATPGRFLQAVAALEGRAAGGRAAAAHEDYLAWSALRPRTGGSGVDIGGVVAALAARLPEDAVIANGAGNYAVWVHRFHRFRRFGTQLAPTSGSMGYGLPAAIAASLRSPDRPVIAFAGDGCFQMTMQELGTAAQSRAPLLLLICDNGMWGTIRMHQERHHPGRVVATDLRNPDFAALARAYGLFGASVDADAAVGPALDEALEWIAEHRLPAVLRLATDRAAITPSQRLAALAEA